jgi:hypothetical protein
MKGSDVESITKLLKAHNVPLSAVRANKLLLSLGILEEAQRESSTRPGVIKKYKVLSEKGLDYGVNEENTQSPDQTSPYYYKDSFAELGRILIEADAASDESAKNNPQATG